MSQNDGWVSRMKFIGIRQAQNLVWLHDSWAAVKLMSYSNCKAGKYEQMSKAEIFQYEQTSHTESLTVSPHIRQISPLEGPSVIHLGLTWSTPTPAINV
ncbi:hypothetical protein MAR_035800 [Mya arenaria]|uniref:Uncharacterized protein n=1 Tax=Mya arenaria TaxID=6604 RepID=A0ABY7ENQ9_MYAAR|nr:hypothetical protein MAR_035800 [Mya arenaria]